MNKSLLVHLNRNTNIDILAKKQIKIRFACVYSRGRGKETCIGIGFLGKVNEWPRNGLGGAGLDQ